MSITPVPEIVPLAADAHGVFRIGTTRVTLDTVISAFANGATPEEIAHQYPSLALADVYSVISYYLRHTAEIDEYLQQRCEEHDNIRRENETKFDPHGIRERLLARRPDDGQ